MFNTSYSYCVKEEGPSSCDVIRTRDSLQESSAAFLTLLLDSSSTYTLIHLLLCYSHTTTLLLNPAWLVSTYFFLNIHFLYNFQQWKSLSTFSFFSSPAVTKCPRNPDEFQDRRQPLPTHIERLICAV